MSRTLGTCTLGTCTNGTGTWLWHLYFWHLYWLYGSGIGSGICIGSGIILIGTMALLALQHVYSRFTQESLTYDDAAGLSPAFLTAAYTI